MNKEQKSSFDKMMNVMNFASIKSQILQDLKTYSPEGVNLYAGKAEDLVKYLKNPGSTVSQKKLRELSRYVYYASSHYRRLIKYYSDILLYNYFISPVGIPDLTNKKNSIDLYKQEYMEIAKQVKKYNLKKYCPNILETAFRDGVFFGICYESKDSFYIQQVDPEYCTISSIEGGTYRYSLDLEYFTGRRKDLLPQYSADIRSAYIAFKGDAKNGIKPNSKLRYYEPKDGCCFVCDETDILINIPFFTGLLKSVFDIEDYKLLKKTKDENDNYRAVTLKPETDDDGIPKMSDDILGKYYAQACNNVPDGVGVIMTPFVMGDLSFAANKQSDDTSLTDAENTFWFDSGTSPLIFGSTKATSSDSLKLSVKPDIKIAFDVLKQIELYFNILIKKMNYVNEFEISFNMQSIFDADEIANRDFKAAQYGVAGSKLKYASDLGLEPIDVVSLSYLEDSVLGIGSDIFTHPLISSNTLSGGKVDTGANNSTDSETGGRPTNDSKGEPLTDNGEKSAEQN